MWQAWSKNMFFCSFALVYLYTWLSLLPVFCLTVQCLVVAHSLWSILKSSVIACLMILLSRSLLDGFPWCVVRLQATTVDLNVSNIPDLQYTCVYTFDMKSPLEKAVTASTIATGSLTCRVPFGTEIPPFVSGKPDLSRLWSCLLLCSCSKPRVNDRSFPSYSFQCLGMQLQNWTLRNVFFSRQFSTTLLQIPLNRFVVHSALPRYTLWSCNQWHYQKNRT